MIEERGTPKELSARLARMEAIQAGHLRRCMFLLVYFTVAFACLAWEWLKHFSLRLEVLPVSTVLVICVWVYFVGKHARELSKLRKLALAASTDADGATTPSPTSEQLSSGEERQTAGV